MSHKKIPHQSRTTILHLAPAMEMTSGAREVLDLCVQTHRSGWRPLVASVGGPLVLEAERAAVRHTEIPPQGKGFWARWRGRKIVEALIDRERPVLIHAHGFDMISLAIKTATAKKLPFLIDLTDPEPVTPGRKKLLHMAAMKGARFRVPSDFMANHLREDFKLESNLLYRVHPGIDLQWYEAARVTPERIHQLSRLWRLPEQSTVLVMATPFATGYGHRLLLEAVAAMKQADFYVVMVGDDKKSPGTRDQIEKWVSALGLEGKVIMPEVCADWPAACWLSSLVIAPNSLPRGQAAELLAAQAIGRPVIVTDCGANKEMVKPNETAWLTPLENKDALVAALTEALSMGPSRRIDLAQQTREFVADFFPMEVWRDSMFEIYDAMLAQPMLMSSVAA